MSNTQATRRRHHHRPAGSGSELSWLVEQGATRNQALKIARTASYQQAKAAVELARDLVDAGTNEDDAPDQASWNNARFILLGMRDPNTPHQAVAKVLHDVYDYGVEELEPSQLKRLIAGALAALKSSIFVEIRVILSTEA